MLYHIICDLIPFNVIVWYNSYFHMLYHIIHNVIPLFVTVYIYSMTFYLRVNQLTACVAQLANMSVTQAVGRGLKPRPDHNTTYFYFYSLDS